MGSRRESIPPEKAKKRTQRKNKLNPAQLLTDRRREFILYVVPAPKKKNQQKHSDKAPSAPRETRKGGTERLHGEGKSDCHQNGPQEPPPQKLSSFVAREGLEREDGNASGVWKEE